MQRFWLRFNTVLFKFRNVSVIYCERVWTHHICSLLRHFFVSITLCHLKHQRFFTESVLWSSHPFLHRRNYYVRVWTRHIFLLLCHRCVSITIRRLKYQRFLHRVRSRSPHPFPHRRNYCVKVWTRQIYSILCHCCVFITLRLLKHQRFFTESALRMALDRTHTTRQHLDSNFEPYHQ